MCMTGANMAQCVAFFAAEVIPSTNRPNLLNRCRSTPASANITVEVKFTADYRIIISCWTVQVTSNYFKQFHLIHVSFPLIFLEFSCKYKFLKKIP
jgi:hypothetical protein